MRAVNSVAVAKRATPFQVHRRVTSKQVNAGRVSHTVVCSASSSRRTFLEQAAVLAAGVALQVSSSGSAAYAGEASGYTVTTSPLCNEACLAALNNKPAVTTNSGLAFRDIVEGDGATPPVGYQVVVNYVAMTADGRIFANSLESKPYDVRVGAGVVIAGLDEGLLSMKSGGIRRLYIPGKLAYPKGLGAAPGRPRVLPDSPVVFDVQLLYVPGLD